MHYHLATALAVLPFLATAWPTIYGRPGLDGANYTGLFAPGLSSNASIHYTTDRDYNTSVTQPWSFWSQPTYSVSIKPATVADVQYIIRTATRRNLPFLATGGKHGGEITFAAVKNAINIDLSNFKENKIDLEANRLTVGPGIAFVDFTANLYKVGKFVPVGNAYCVNMIGATVGAGIGPFQGLHGLVLDALRSVRIVTATGDVVTASETEHEGLFWAIRGAGANFGVIVSATYEIFDAPNNGQVILADFAFRGSVNASLWNLLQSWDQTYPQEMGLTLSASFNKTTFETSLSASMTFFGPQTGAQPWIDQMLALGPTRFQNTSLPWSSASAAASFGAATNACRKGQYNSHPTVGANQTSPESYVSVLKQYMDTMRTRPWFNGVFVVQRFANKATLALPKEKQGVYPGRDIKILIVFNNFSDGPIHDDEVYNFTVPLRAQLAATSGFGKLKTYINYANGDEGPEVWFGKENLPRLIRLKRKWDPRNKFGPGNPIPLSLEGY